VLAEEMTVNYFGFYAALTTPSVDLVSLVWTRGNPAIDFTSLWPAPSGTFSFGSSYSQRIDDPPFHESTEQLAHTIEDGLDPLGVNLFGRRITYFNPLFIPKRKQAVEVLRTYF
jgi:hypothetical protein